MNNLKNLNQKSTPIKQIQLMQILSLIILFTAPMIAFGSVEGSLAAVQEKLVGTILPLGAMCGLVVAGLSFVAGHANAKSHLMYAIMGAIVGFGAESIVSLIRSLVH